jgi:hypothetical protein
MFGSEMKFTHFEKSFELSAAGIVPFCIQQLKNEQTELSLISAPGRSFGKCRASFGGAKIGWGEFETYKLAD